MEDEIKKGKDKSAVKNIREKFRPFTLRDLKAGRGNWNDDDFYVDDSKEINLLPDAMIDKIVSLYGFVIKSNKDQNLEVLRNKLFAIVYHLAATNANCSEMHQFCPTGEESWCEYQKAVSLIFQLRSTLELYLISVRSVFLKCCHITC